MFVPFTVNPINQLVEEIRKFEITIFGEFA